MPRLVVTRIALCAGLTGGVWGGCGDGAAGPDGPPDGRPDLGAYDDPADFDRSGCVAGSLGALAAPTILHASLVFEDFSSAGAFRVDSPEAGAINGFATDRAILTPDDLFLHVTFEDGTVRALDLCARDADGTYRGQYARCFEGECLLGMASAREVRRLPEAAEQGLTRLGEYGGAGAWPAISVNVRVRDGIAYLARYGDGLRIVDVTTPSAPVELGHQAVEFPDASEIWNDVKIVTGSGGQTYALMASNRAGVVVVDVTQPATPSIVAHLGTQAPTRSDINVHTLFVAGTRAYLANTDLGLEIWDVADPRLPSRLGGWSANGYLHDLFVRGGRAYLNYWGDGMIVADVTNPAAVAPLGAFANYGEHSSHSSWVVDVGTRDVALHGDEQYGAHLRLVDVTEGTPGFLQELGAWQTRPEVSIHNVMALGTLGVIAHYQDGVRVIDLADPTAPRAVAWFNTWPGYAPGYGNGFFEGAVGVDVDATLRRIYVADSHRGLIILQLSQTSDLRPQTSGP